MTVDKLIQSCMPAIGLPVSPIQTDILDMALISYNSDGKTIFNSWPWDNGKLDPFTAPAADVNGIITFAANVDIIRAIRFGDSGGGIFNEDEILAARYGETVSSDSWQTMADDATGVRRIRISTDKVGLTCTVLASKRFVEAIVDPLYNVLTPAATPTDYRVVSFEIDRAESALREFISDALRSYVGIAPVGKGSGSLQVAINREEGQQNKERRIIPKVPMFGRNRFSFR